MTGKIADKLLWKHCVCHETKRLSLPVDPGPGAIARKEGHRVEPLPIEERELSGRYDHSGGLFIEHHI